MRSTWGAFLLTERMILYMTEKEFMSGSELRQYLHISTRKIKYLMDNSEVYGGLGAAIALLATLEDAGVSQEAVQPEALIERRERLSRQIEGLLWNAPEQRYETGLVRHNQPLQ